MEKLFKMNVLKALLAEDQASIPNWDNLLIIDIVDQGIYTSARSNKYSPVRFFLIFSTKKFITKDDLLSFNKYFLALSLQKQ